MIRKAVGAFCLLAVVAIKAQAQEAPYQETFAFHSATSGNFSTYQGEFTSSAQPSLGYTGEAVNAPFQIWCIDPLHYTGTTNAGYSAWVTPLLGAGSVAQTDLSKAYGAGGTSPTLTQLKTAAYLAYEMGTNNFTGTQATDYEAAIWYAMGYTSNTVGSTSYNPSLPDATALGYYNNVTDADRSEVNLADWGVINETGPSHHDVYGSGSSTQYQEFLYCNQASVASCISIPSSPPPSVTPEPATMSLLAMGIVGIAGTSVRRRKRKR